MVSVHASDALGVGAEVLDGRRRLEMRTPTLAAEILRVLDEPVPAAALGLLGIAEREVKSKVPVLAWGDVTMVLGWISELANDQGRGSLAVAPDAAQQVFSFHPRGSRGAGEPIHYVSGEQ